MTVTEDTILERLAACHEEIMGVKKWHKLPVVSPIPDEELPFGYTLVGPMLETAPNESAGQYVTNRRYIARLFILPSAVAEDMWVSNDNPGARAIYDAVQFIQRFAAYYTQHPRLSTSTLAALVLTGDLVFADTGPVQRQGPGGGQYIAVDWNLNIAYRGTTSQTAYLRGS